MKSLTVFASTAIIPAAGFFLFFLRTENWRASLRLVSFGWRPLFVAGVVNNPFYQWCLGLDAPGDHLRQTSLYFLVCGLIFIFYAALFKRLNRLAPPWQGIAHGVAAAPLLLAAVNFDWLGCGAALPLLGLVSIGILIWRWRQSPNHQRVCFPLLWSIFALLLLAKQGLFPRIWHTGFALAMPAFVSATYLLLRLLPDFFEIKFQVPHRPLRTGAMAVLIIALTSLANTSGKFYSAKQLAVGQGADRIMASGPAGNSVEGRNLNLALAWIQQNVPPHATLATLPEGVLLNYLSRHANPTPDIDWNPTVMAVFGAELMATALEQNPPDFIALVEWQTYEFGTGYFGSQPGYGAEVMTWIQKNYQPVALFGSEPLRNGLFGIKILKRLPANSAAGLGKHN